MEISTIKKRLRKEIAEHYRETLNTVNKGKDPISACVSFGAFEESVSTAYILDAITEIEYDLLFNCVSKLRDKVYIFHYKGYGACCL